MSDEGPFPCEECGAEAALVVVMVEFEPVAISIKPVWGVGVSSLWFCADHEVLAFRVAHRLRFEQTVLTVEVIQSSAVAEYLTLVQTMIEEFLNGKAVSEAFGDQPNGVARRARSARRHRQRRSGSLAQRARPHRPPQAS